MNKPDITNFAPDMDSIRIDFDDYAVLVSREDTGAVHVVVEEKFSKTNFAEMILGENEDF